MVVLMISVQARAQIQINPQLGFNFMGYTNPPEGADYKAEAGFMLGCDLRFGERFQLQPGLFYMSTKSVTELENSGGTVEGDIEHGWIRLKGFGAYNLIDGESFKLRINGGPSYDFLLSAKNQDGDDVKDDLNKGNFSMNLGLGADIWIITADLGYSFGFSDVFSDENVSPDSKYQGLYFTVGVIFGDGKD